MSTIGALLGTIVTFFALYVFLAFAMDIACIPFRNGKLEPKYTRLVIQKSISCLRWSVGQIFVVLGRGAQALGRKIIP